MVTSADTTDKIMKEGVILRDNLSTDRTILANERTFLSYLRTSLAFVVTGISLIKFFNSFFTSLLGWVFIPLGLTSIFIGIRSFQKMDAIIKEENHKHNVIE